MRGLGLGTGMAKRRDFAASTPTPDEIADLLVWVDAQTGVYQDTAGTTPATTNGQYVLRWDDQSGNGNNIINPIAPANRASLLVDGFSSGVNAVRFLNGLLQIDGIGPISRQDCSSYVVARRTNYARSCILNTFPTAASNVTGYTMLNTGWQRPSSGGLTDYRQCRIGWPFDEFAILSQFPGSDGITFGINERTSFIDRAPPDVSDQGVGLGVAGGSQTEVNVVEMLFYNRSLETAERAAVLSYLTSKYGITTPARTHNLVFHGDSITKGFTANVRPYFDKAAVDAGISEYDYLNYGDPGATAASLATAAETLSPSLYIDDIPNIACVWAGTNDNANNVAVATIQASYQALCEEWRAAGFSVVASTMIDRSSIFANGQTEAGFRTAMETFNTWLRANWATFADALADPADNTNLGPDGSSQSTTYFQDGTHPKQAGHDLIAPYFQAAIEAILAA